MSGFDWLVAHLLDGYITGCHGEARFDRDLDRCEYCDQRDECDGSWCDRHRPDEEPEWYEER